MSAFDQVPKRVERALPTTFDQVPKRTTFIKREVAVRTRRRKGGGTFADRNRKHAYGFNILIQGIKEQNHAR